jgi:RNA polymerase primary sigma factor
MGKMREFKAGTGGASPNSKEVYNKYLSEISKLKPLTREKEVELFKKIKLNGDKEAIDTICKHNLLFVVSVARKYSKQISSTKLTLEDLINEGNIGLYSAIGNFDYTTGNKFISYAVWCIRGAIINFIKNNVKTIRTPQSIFDVVNKSKKEEEKLEQILERTPTTLELFNSMVKNGVIKESYTESRLKEGTDSYRFEKSLSTPIGEEGDMELADLIKSDSMSPDTELLEKERNDKIDMLLNRLPEKIKNYFIDYFGLYGQERLTLAKMSVKYDEGRQTIQNRIERHLRQIKGRNRGNREYFFSNVK